MLKPGDAAPDFVLKDQDGEDFRLSSLSGKLIILFFYPKDDTPGCRMESRRFSALHQELFELDARVVGASLDSVASHKQFADACNLPYPILSDPEGRVHDLFEAWRTTMLGKIPLAVRRCTFLIDEDGIIRRAYGNINVFGHAKQVLRDVQRLHAQRSWGKRDARMRDLMP